MLDKLQNVFNIPELKKRVLFTAALLIVYRLGGHIPTPGVDVGALQAYFAQNQGTLFGLYDMFVSALSRDSAGTWGGSARGARPASSARRSWAWPMRSQIT